MKTALLPKRAIGSTGTAVALAVSALCYHGVAQAGSFGEMHARSPLGAPFAAEVELLLTPAEIDAVLVKAGGARAYEAAGLRYSNVAGDLRVKVSERGGHYYAILSTTVAATEPVVTLLLEAAGSTGKTSRTYSVALMPPQAPAGRVAAEVVPGAAPAQGAERIPPARSAADVLQPTQAAVRTGTQVPPVLQATQDAGPIPVVRTAEVVPPAQSAVRIADQAVPRVPAQDAMRIAAVGTAAVAPPLAQVTGRTTALAAPPAQTAVHTESPVAPPVQDAVRIAEVPAVPGVPLRVTEKGMRPAQISRVTARGDAMAMGKALGMIVPQGWRGFTADGAVKAAAPIDWEARDMPWPEALARVLAERQIVATIDWNRKEIEFAMSKATPGAIVAARVASIPAAIQDPTPALKPAPTPAPGVAVGPAANAAAVAATVPSAQPLREAPMAGQARSARAGEADTTALMHRIKIEGAMDGVAAQSVSSLGVNVNVVTAITQIAPEGWMVITRERKLGDSALVGWSGRDRPWLTVLDELLARTRFSAIVNVQRHEIEIYIER